VDAAIAVVFVTDLAVRLVYGSAEGVDAFACEYDATGVGAARCVVRLEAVGVDGTCAMSFQHRCHYGPGARRHIFALRFRGATRTEEKWTKQR